MSDDNLFDDDDALDCILFEEANKETTDGGKGCFRMIVLLIIPVIGLGYPFLNNFF